MPKKTHVPAGTRDRWITIQQMTASKGATNFPMETWSFLRQDYASKEDVGGTERFVASADQHSAPYDTRWEVTYQPDMDPELIDVPKFRRLVLEGRIHNIVAASEIGRKRAVELLTQAGGTLA